jgi:hypothetical protein
MLETCLKSFYTYLRSFLHFSTNKTWWRTAPVSFDVFFFLIQFFYFSLSIFSISIRSHLFSKHLCKREHWNTNSDILFIRFRMAFYFSLASFCMCRFCLISSNWIIMKLIYPFAIVSTYSSLASYVMYIEAHILFSVSENREINSSLRNIFIW